MLLSTAAASLTLVSLASHAYATQIPVVVGGIGILQYSPEYVYAEVGDEIVFSFEQDNHTVTESTFDSPCSIAPGAFDSGFVVVADSVTSDFPTATLTVTDTEPIWIFCRQTGACQQGMVFAVNPGYDFVAFKAAANASETSTSDSYDTTTLSVATPTPSVFTVTDTITAGGETWTTTYGSYTGSAEPTSYASVNHKVVVGGDSLTYSPSDIIAQPGDTITFQFKQENHTATQSTFSNPCEKLEGGFDSGFYYVAEDATEFPEYTITVNDTAPIWVYCAQGKHCAFGMVFSVNAIEPNDFTAFQGRANATNTTATTSSATSTTTTYSSGSTCAR